jgi:CDGSH-type Zn-finger protein
MANTDLPKIVARQSKHENLSPGVYYFCTCGLSKDGLYCDNSHQGTGFEPKRFKIDEPRSVSLCLCKHSKNNPYCDGSHKQLLSTHPLH